jgi:hypothetical protein
MHYASYYHNLVTNIKPNSPAHIVVHDNVMGSGKTTAMFNMMEAILKKDLSARFVYVSPLLKEVGGYRLEKDGKPIGNYQLGRVQERLPEYCFMFPLSTGEGKTRAMMELIATGENIACTHSCFQCMTKDDIALIESSGYTLIIDESIDAYETLAISKSDLKMALISGTLLVDKTNALTWDTINNPIDEIDSGWQREVANICENHSAWLIDGQVVLSEFPMPLLKAFVSVEVMTYMFEATTMAAWCKANDVTIVKSDVLLQFDMRTEVSIKSMIKDKIRLYQPKSRKNFALSYNWWANAKQPTLDTLTTHAFNFAKSINKLDGIKANDMIVTCPKNKWFTDTDNNTGKGKARGRSYSKATWVSNTCRATNAYSDKRAVLYMSNKSPSPMLTKHLSSVDVRMDRMDYALSELLQFVWRGCIRNGETMHLYIMNQELEKAFSNWLDNDVVYTQQVKDCLSITLPQLEFKLSLAKSA